MSEKRCKNCEYCDDTGEVHINKGICRIKPPEIIETRNSPKGLVRVYAWPSVTLDRDWCGKHSLKVVRNTRREPKL